VDEEEEEEEEPEAEEPEPEEEVDDFLGLGGPPASQKKPKEPKVKKTVKTKKASKPASSNENAVVTVKKQSGADVAVPKIAPPPSGTRPVKKGASSKALTAKTSEEPSPAGNDGADVLDDILGFSAPKSSSKSGTGKTATGSNKGTKKSSKKPAKEEAADDDDFLAIAMRNAKPADNKPAALPAPKPANPFDDLFG